MHVRNTKSVSHAGLTTISQTLLHGTAALIMALTIAKNQTLNPCFVKWERKKSMTQFLLGGQYGWLVVKADCTFM